MSVPTSTSTRTRGTHPLKAARERVPKELVGRSVEVLTAEDGIDIHHGDELVATHPLNGSR